MDLFGQDSKALEDIEAKMDAFAIANSAASSASQVLTKHMSEYAQVVAGDTRMMVDGLQRQLRKAKAELVELQESYIAGPKFTSAQPSTKTIRASKARAPPPSTPLAATSGLALTQAAPPPLQR